MNPKFSIIIINWNTKVLTDQCIRSVFEKNADCSFELILVDNASQDGSREFFANYDLSIKFIKNENNKGYAAANNIALKKATGEYILLLNSDTEMITKNPLVNVKSIFEKNDDIGIIGAKQILPNGRVQAIGRQFLTVQNLFKQQILFNSFFKHHSADEQLISCDYVDGAFLAIRKNVIEKIGELDSSYFVYGEDMEWCWRAKKAGFNIVADPGIEIRHYHGSSSVQNYKESLLNNMQNNSRFIAQTQGCLAGYSARFIYMIGMLIRVPLSIIRRNKLAGSYLTGFLGGFKILLKKLECK